MRPPPPVTQTTTLWDFPSRNYLAVGTSADGGKYTASAAKPSAARQGSAAYQGSTPAGVLWNLIRRYTRPGDLVVDPMAGSGTTLDVARELDRRALGYDLAVVRPDVFRADARKLPLEDAKADFVFADPPYSTHLEYSQDPRCIGRLDAAGPAYYQALEAVFDEWLRILRPDRYAALYVGDSFVKGKGFYPIGMELFRRLAERFVPVDHIAVVRHNRNLSLGNHHRAAEEGNFLLRGFHHLFVVHKPPAANKKPRPLGPAAADTRPSPGPKKRPPPPRPRPRPRKRTD